MFVERYGADVLRWAQSLASPADAQDAAQETLLAVWQHAGSFRGEASARTWTLHIARNVVRRRRPKVEALTSPAEEPLEVLGAQAGFGHRRTPEDWAALAEQREQLGAALATLSDDDRAVLLLCDIEGLSRSEAAAVMELSVATVKVRLHRARLKLMAGLTSRGHR